MANSSLTLRLAWLYPRRMNIYGDRGNVTVLQKRAEWRGFKVQVDMIEVGNTLQAADYDLFFFGGGQDQEQFRVAADLQRHGEALQTAVEKGAALLAVCGGYQLLGHYYQPDKAERLPGIGLFDAWTEAGPKRLIGNVVASSVLSTMPIVGFENHSGLTHLGDKTTPFATVERGYGNNGQDQTEGCQYLGAVGTYLHGSLLPKNPQLADWLLQTALQRRHPESKLKPLDDSAERAANDTIRAR